MRIFIILIFSIFTGTALAETVTIEASQDNTLYESSQGALSNGAGSNIFSGQTNEGEIRRAVVAFKDLSAIPAGATITSAKLHLYLNKTSADPTMLNLLRLQSDWGEGASDASGSEGKGAPAQMGDATWNHTFFDNMTWNTPGGDFSQASSATSASQASSSSAWRRADTSSTGSMAASTSVMAARTRATFAAPSSPR